MFSHLATQPQLSPAQLPPRASCWCLGELITHPEITTRPRALGGEARAGRSCSAPSHRCPQKKTFTENFGGRDQLGMDVGTQFGSARWISVFWKAQTCTLLVFCWFCSYWRKNKWKKNQTNTSSFAFLCMGVLPCAPSPCQLVPGACTAGTGRLLGLEAEQGMQHGAHCGCFSEGKSLGSTGTAPLSAVAWIRDPILLGIIIIIVIFPIGLFLTGLIPCPGLCASSGPAERGEHTGSCRGARGRICPSLAHFPCSRALE